MKNIEQVYSYIKEHNMIREGSRVCVGLSGGADSVCLLQLLYELRDRLKITVCAFHVNHMLRGDEGDSDQHFSESFCEDRGVELKTFKFDVAAIARENKKGLEEMGRILRRQTADELVRSGFADRIALAHHINDRVETVLFNMARGSSIRGLKGISPVNGYVIRPLLCMSRNEIEEELKSRNISWCTDSTNLKDDYSRNKTRINILPYLEENINAQSIRHICQAAEDIEEADEILRELAKEKAGKLVSKKDGSIYIKSAILQEKKLIAGYILMDALVSLTKSAVDLTRGHTYDILELFEKQSGKRLNLPYNVCAESTYDGIRLYVLRKELEEKNEEMEKILPVDLSVDIGTYRVKTHLLKNGEKAADIPREKYRKWFDFDSVSSYAVLRYRRAGDYLIVDPAGHKKKLKDYFIDEKVPREKRDKVLCLAKGSEIIWAAGYRISENYKVSPDTENIIEVQILSDKD